MINSLNILQREILRMLQEKETSYANPITSQEIGQFLKVTPSYIREQMKILQKMTLVEVRNGRGGGYFIRNDKNSGETLDGL